ncbi:hypothetical protein C7212DRAFT_346843 [Tuber magnatum]|uniref:Uncharacterized protein n=1 Tax=Tuber magnatum TaxID=42249 RepID=A0A317SI03_9PEZI|nr:hypothetical protein C7212DRAFT_346843 [Tuber magnatum]
MADLWFDGACRRSKVREKDKPGFWDEIPADLWLAESCSFIMRQTLTCSLVSAVGRGKSAGSRTRRWLTSSSARLQSGVSEQDQEQSSDGAAADLWLGHVAVDLTMVDLWLAEWYRRLQSVVISNRWLAECCRSFEERLGLTSGSVGCKMDVFEVTGMSHTPEKVYLLTAYPERCGGAIADRWLAGRCRRTLYVSGIISVSRLPQYLTFGSMGIAEARCKRRYQPCFWCGEISDPRLADPGRSSPGLTGGVFSFRCWDETIAYPRFHGCSSIRPFWDDTTDNLSLAVCCRTLKWLTSASLSVVEVYSSPSTAITDPRQ